MSWSAETTENETFFSQMNALFHQDVFPYPIVPDGICGHVYRRDPVLSWCIFDDLRCQEDIHARLLKMPRIVLTPRVVLHP